MIEGDSAFTPIEAYGVIGDRRTAALVSDRGRIDWLALPDFDGRTIFGQLLDPSGGSWRFGPQQESPGFQRYEPGTCILTTRWEAAVGTLELTDFMAWPESDRPEGVTDVRLVARRLRTLALMGRGSEAEHLLTSLEGQLPLGLLPEEIDARSGRFLGNTPLMFAHVEYLRARLQLAGSPGMGEGE